MAAQVFLEEAGVGNGWLVRTRIGVYEIRVGVGWVMTRSNSVMR